MPTYTFRNKETKETFEIVMKMVELDEYKKDNPHLEIVITYAPPLKYNNHGKPDDGFRDVLRKIKKEHPRGDVNTFD
jgi:hypothetical protein